jgi:hypothetical protein
MPKQLTDEQKRIARDLKQGTKDLPPKQMVHVQSGDVFQLVTALEAETARADAAEAALPPKPDTRIAADSHE